MTYSEKNITVSSLCTCNQVESVAHFLLYCPLFNRQRHDLPCQPTVNNIFFGENSRNMTMTHKRNQSLQNKWFQVTSN